MEEIWKDIEDFEGRYKVSNKGRIVSYVSNYHSPRIKSAYLTRSRKIPKLAVKLYKDGITRKFHVACLVLRAFRIKPHKAFKQAIFKDGNVLNCRLDNLCWGKQSIHQNPPWSLCKTVGEPKKRLFSSSDKTPKERGLQTLRNLE